MSRLTADIHLIMPNTWTPQETNAAYRAMIHTLLSSRPTLTTSEKERAYSLFCEILQSESRTKRSFLAQFKTCKGSPSQLATPPASTSKKNKKETQKQSFDDSEDEDKPCVPSSGIKNEQNEIEVSADESPSRKRTKLDAVLVDSDSEMACDVKKVRRLLFPSGRDADEPLSID